MPADYSAPDGFVALRDWLRTSGVDSGDARVRHLVGDVSRRRYLRLEPSDPRSRPLVLAWYPPDMEAVYRAFVKTSQLLQSAGVPVPRIVATDEERRFMALEDVGDRSLYSLAVGSLQAHESYTSVLDLISRLRTVDRAAVAELHPPLDSELFWREIEQTRELFLRPALRRSRVLAEKLDSTLEITVDELDEQSRVVTHRDLMARNIQVTASGVVLLDHQDLRLGPPGYDLASLLHDSLRLSPRQRKQVELTALQRGLCQVDSVRDRRIGCGREAASYWLCVVQRMSKIIGTFCQFALGGGRRHLPLIPAAIESLCEGLQRTALWPEAGTQLAPALLRYWSANLDDFGEDRMRP